jgi:hypothetical protein
MDKSEPPEKTITFVSSEDLVSKLPRPGYGIIVAVIFFLFEVYYFSVHGEQAEPSLGIWAVGLIGVIYWLVCVYQIHKVLELATKGAYKISPGRAVGYHFIPFYNLLWPYKWIVDLLTFANNHLHAGQNKISVFMGLAILPSLLIAGLIVGRFLDGAVGLAIDFGVLMYLVGKLRHCKFV